MAHISSAVLEKSYQAGPEKHNHWLVNLGDDLRWSYTRALYPHLQTSKPGNLRRHHTLPHDMEGKMCKIFSRWRYAETCDICMETLSTILTAARQRNMEFSMWNVHDHRPFVLFSIDRQCNPISGSASSDSDICRLSLQEIIFHNLAVSLHIERSQTFEAYGLACELLANEPYLRLLMTSYNRRTLSKPTFRNQ